MVAGRKIWERTDMEQATNAVRRENRRIGEATVVKGGNTSPSSMFLSFCGPNTCHSDQAGARTHAVNNCTGVSISAEAYSKDIPTYKCWFSSCNPQLPLDP